MLSNLWLYSCDTVDNAVMKVELENIVHPAQDLIYFLRKDTGCIYFTSKRSSTQISCI